MDNSPGVPSSALSGFKRFTVWSRSRNSTYVVMGLVILLLDVFTGRFLLFPILFVVPVVLSAWFCSARLAYSLAVLLPVGRFFIAAFWELPSPIPYIAANAVTRIALLVLLAFLVSRTARQTKELEQHIGTLMKVCAWSRTVEYQGEWISFEEYMRRRFNIETTHGMSPDEAQRQFDLLMQDDRKA